MLLTFFVSLKSLAFEGREVLLNSSIPLNVKEKLQLEMLHNDPRWLKLLHYKENVIGKSFTSIVDDKTFFLSSSGKVSPQKELYETVKLFIHFDSSKDERVCQFPARLKFLIEKNILAQSYDTKFKCDEYRQWRQENITEKIWLVFPSAYLNSPSSMFGHTFLRLDPFKQQSKLLSKAVNYAANTEETDTGMLYAIKGLFGGFPGYYSMTAYHEKVKTYNRIENRDIWEYRLDLEQDDIDWILRHLWELDKIKSDYFFTTQNCSYQLLSLLDVVRPTENFTASFEVFAIPLDTIRILEKKSMIVEQRFRPSQSSEFNQALKMLTEQEKRLVKRLKVDTLDELASDLDVLDIPRKALVLNTAYKFSRLHPKVRKDKNKSMSLLRARSELGLIKATVNDFEKDSSKSVVSPTQGHNTRRLSIAVGELNDQVSARIAYKFNYHSISDPLLGYAKESHINFFNIEAQLQSGNHHLEKLDIIDIRSLSSSNQFIRRRAWQVKTGLERKLVSTGSDKLIPDLNFGFGYVHAINELKLYGLVGLNAEYHKEYEKNLQIAPRLDLGGFAQLSRFALESNFSVISLEAEDTWRISTEMLASYHLTRSISLSARFKYELLRSVNNRRQFDLGVRYYF